MNTSKSEAEYGWSLWEGKKNKAVLTDKLSISRCCCYASIILTLRLLCLLFEADRSFCGVIWSWLHAQKPLQEFWDVTAKWQNGKLTVILPLMWQKKKKFWLLLTGFIKLSDGLKKFAYNPPWGQNLTIKTQNVGVNSFPVWCLVSQSITVSGD